jgi:tetratricopeptide (TPR) repeat protein
MPWIVLAAMLPSLEASAPVNLLDRANAAYGVGRMREAVGLYKKAAASGGNPTLCYFNLANAYFQLDSLAQAIVYYKASLTDAPDFFRGHLNLAIGYYTLDDAGNCIAEVRRALEIQPQDPKALLILAAAYCKAHAYPQAITAFERLAASNPELEEPCIALGEMYRDLGDLPTAASWLSRYPDSGKNRAYVALLLADLYEQQGELSRSLYCLRNAFALDNKNRWIYYRMVRIMQGMGNDLVALEEAKQGLAIFPNFADLALLAGNIAFANQRYEEAETLYTRARAHGSAGAIVGLENIRAIRNQTADRLSR